MGMLPEPNNHKQERKNVMNEKEKDLIQALQYYFGAHFVNIHNEEILNAVTQTILAYNKGGLNGDHPWAQINRAIQKLTTKE